MKKLLFVVIALCFAASLAYAEEATETTTMTTTVAAPAATNATETMTGTIIDNLCADANKADVSNFVKIHTKSCATMPACAASGYSIVVDGKITKFDQASNAKVSEFLQSQDSKLDVTVEVTKAGEELSLVSIKNQ